MFSFQTLTENPRAFIAVSAPSVQKIVDQI